MILSCNNVSKSFGENAVLSGVSFLLNERERAAVIGVNGCGKTTLFKIILGELSPSGGEVIFKAGTETGYFSQDITIDSENTIYGEMFGVFEDVYRLEEEKHTIEGQMKSADGAELERLMRKYDLISAEFENKNGFETESRIRGVIKGLGFSEEEAKKKINTLSGGQKTRAALGRLLLLSPDILLLDEPTNHLDIDSVKWLEAYLSSYSGTVVIISHDRYFIDRVTSKIIEIENGTAKVYNGNYSQYMSRKEKERESQLHRYINNQREIKKQQEAIAKLKSFNREKSVKRAESKEKALEKMEIVKSPDPLPERMRLKLVPGKESGNDVLSVEGLTKAYGNNRLFENISFEIKKGERVALIGANGTGKTTIFKIITGLVRADKGIVKKGANVETGYFDQEHESLNQSKTIFDEISDENPKLTTTEIRNLLAALVFKGDDVFKPIGLLSGGEKGRTALAKLSLSKANLLLLDEPTNHLDIYSKELLEEALISFKGTVLFVSHDRYFINKVATRIIELTDKGIKNYSGNYDYYEEKKTESQAEAAAPREASENKLDWQKQKELLSEKRKAETRQKRLLAEAEQTEQKIEELEKLLETEEVATDPKKAEEAYNAKTELEERLLEIYDMLE
ncbi:MAG: ATP-binding cassette domain-containing protein [Clostridiales bacterium]|nr:ATP-binding cassette domain-containing protein [Clostridiales bacterium]